MSNPKNDLLSLHPAALAGSILDARPQAHAAAEDAEPETAERRESFAALAGALPGPPQGDRAHPRPAAPNRLRPGYQEKSAKPATA